MKRSNFQFHAAPKGKTCGVASQSHGDYRLTVIILPKLWNNKIDVEILHLWPAEKFHLVISTYETKRFQVKVENESQEDILIQFGGKIADEKGLSNEALLVEEIPSTDYQSLPSSHSSEDNFSDLFALCCLYQHANIGSLRPMFGWSSSHPLMQLFTMKQFVDATKPIVQHLRANYLRKVERTSSLQGRITGRGMVQYTSTASTELECEFEDFTTNIPLYRIIITALFMVQNHNKNAATEIWNLQRDAKQIRTKLNHIRPYSVQQALHIGSQLRLNRLERNRWEKPLKLALAILQHQGLELEKTTHVQGFVWDINTATQIWETLTLNAAKSAVSTLNSENAFCIGPKEQQIGLEIYNPWMKETKGSEKKNGMIQPDILFYDGANMHCWDAKYKIIGKSGTRDDYYQMFAYSHLVAFKSGKDILHPTKLALLYPSLTKKGTQSSLYRSPVLEEDKPVILTAYSVPFPSRDIVQKHSLWRIYQQNLVGVMVDAIRDPVRST